MPFNKIKPSDIFICKKCGDCCKGFGGTYVTAADVEKIAAYVNTDPKSFIAEYCTKSGNKLVLSQADSGYCIFWDDLCTIHPVKPRMCRAWPFIESVLVDINNWRIMADSCPGIITDVPDELVQKCIKAVFKHNSPKFT
jgi:Fe-S-cluster containining protein